MRHDHGRRAPGVERTDDPPRAETLHGNARGSRPAGREEYGHAGATHPDRRTVLAAGAAALSGLAVATTTGPARAAAAAGSALADCARPHAGPGPRTLPNVVVTAHDGRRALFYDDLLAGRTVMVHCLAIAREAEYPVVDNLVRVQRLLGPRVGRDVFMYSLAIDPEDTPRALAAFAAERGIGPGWLLLTAEPDGMALIRSRLWAHGGGHAHAGHPHGAEGGPETAPPRDCSLGLVRYGNEAIGLWGAVPAKADPEWIARRLSWVAPRPAPAGPPRRRGPTPTTYRT